MKYEARFEVTAQAIASIEPLEHRGVLDVGAQFGLLLILEDGTKFPAGRETLVRHVPSAGDFLVTAPDGFVSIVPKEVFAKRYQVLVEEASDETDTNFFGIDFNLIDPPTKEDVECAVVGQHFKLVPVEPVETVRPNKES